MSVFLLLGLSDAAIRRTLLHSNLEAVIRERNIMIRTRMHSRMSETFIKTHTYVRTYDHTVGDDGRGLDDSWTCVARLCGK